MALESAEHDSVVTMHHRVIDWPQGETAGHANEQLSTEAPQSKQNLSYHRSRSNLIALITEVDQWPGTWGTVFDLSQNRIVQHPSPNWPWCPNWLRASCQLQPARCRRTLRCGPMCRCKMVDRNCKLVGIETAIVRSSANQRWRSMSFQAFGRCSKEWMLRAQCSSPSRIQPVHVSLPVTGLPDQRVSLLAVLDQDGQTLAWSHAQVVVDKQIPTLAKAYVADGKNCLLGAPVEVRIVADDQGLSGVAMVEAAWSLGGRLNLTADMKPTPAICVLTDRG